MKQNLEVDQCSLQKIGIYDGEVKKKSAVLDWLRLGTSWNNIYLQHDATEFLILCLNTYLKNTDAKRHWTETEVSINRRCGIFPIRGICGSSTSGWYLGDILGIFQVHLQLKMTDVITIKDSWKLSPRVACKHKFLLIVNLSRLPDYGQV